jgi:hypothetical protein
MVIEDTDGWSGTVKDWFACMDWLIFGLIDC